jgi:hypothetical protein
MLWQRTDTYARPRNLDLWVRPEQSNAQRVLQALSDFGAPLSDLTADDLSRKETIFQIGLPPLLIAIITDIDGVEFAQAWPDRLETSFGGVPAFVISRQHLITNKKTAARLQDLADVEQLETAGVAHTAVDLGVKKSMSRRRVKHTPEIEDTLRALRRAAKRALELGLQTGTPVYIWKNNKIVDLTKELPSKKSKSKRPSR